MFYKIYCYPNHALEAVLSHVHVPARLTRLAFSLFQVVLAVDRCHIVQVGRSFVPACVQLLNSLVEPCFAGHGVAAFRSQISRALLFD